MKSQTLSIYRKWLETASRKDIDFVDMIFAECEKHYEDGGDTVVECFSPEEILEEFESIEDAREYCGLRVEDALNKRWGEDTDPELEKYNRAVENFYETNTWNLGE